MPSIQRDSNCSPGLLEYSHNPQIPRPHFRLFLPRKHARVPFHQSVISALTSTSYSPLHVQQQRNVASLNVQGVSDTCLSDLKTLLGGKYYSFR